MDCPSCEKPMIVVEREQIELDYCMFCKGTSTAPDEFSLLILKSQPNTTTATLDDYLETQHGHTLSKILSQYADVTNTTEKHYPCPRCQCQMTKIDVSKTGAFYLDRCPNHHGLWFEHNETEATISELVKNHFNESETLNHISHYVENTVYPL